MQPCCTSGQLCAYFAIALFSECMCITICHVMFDAVVLSSKVVSDYVYSVSGCFSGLVPDDSHLASNAQTQDASIIAFK